MASPGVKRKLTTILSADVAGYSRLMGVDEEATLRTLTAYRQVMDGLIGGHDGRVVGTAGDSVLAEFVSTVEAARCAVAIQEELAARNAELPSQRRMEFRIGINLGDVMVRDGDLFGDGVNVAARLQELASPGGIYVSGGVYDQIQDKLDLGYRDLGPQQVKNIAKPVRAYRLGATEGVTGTRRRGRRPIMVAAALLAVVSASLAAWAWYGWWPASLPALPEQPAIAVLPFENMSGDPAQDYFSDGITEDLITDLSQISGLFVIARNSSFTYKGAPVKVQQVGRELGVHYVLEGSVRRSGTRIRVNAQLVDARTGRHLWAERYDRELTEVFALQDEITRKIVAALAVKLTQDEAARLSRAAKVDPEAYDLVLRGNDRLVRFTPQTHIEARELFERAIAIDPDFVRAYTNLAVTYSWLSDFEGTEARDEALRRASEYAQFALALDPTVPQAHFALAGVRIRQRRFDEAVASARRAIELDPNYADGHGMVGNVLNYAGRPQEGYRAIQMAMRLNPRHGFVYYWIVGESLFQMGRTEEAVSAYKKAVEFNPQFARARRRLAAAYGQMGRIEDAEWEAAELLTLEPDFTLARARETATFKNPAHLERYIEGLRKAGLPE